ALEQGLENLRKHVQNVTQHYGLSCVVAINRFSTDTEAEIALVRERVAELGVKVALADHWAHGGKGAVDLAREVVRLVESGGSDMRYVYEDGDSLWDKLRKVATRIYDAADVHAARRLRVQIEQLQADGYGHYPVCVAKTQYSFSTDASARGVAKGHVITIRAVRLCAGAEFVVMICDDIMTMPGLPKEPCAACIDIDEDGRISGLY